MAAVSVFVLVIFGFALVIYSPSNNTETERQTAAAFTPGTAVSQARQNVINGETASRVDPDSWARNPENTPGLDTEIVAAGSAGNLTDLNAAYGGNRTETAQENPETINVRSLTARAPQQKEPASGTAQAERQNRRKRRRSGRRKRKILRQKDRPWNTGFRPVRSPTN